MPNWCSTTYRFRGTKNELELLNGKIKEWTSGSTMTTDFGDSWLGNIVIGAGFKDRIDNEDPSLIIRCRGTLTDIGDVEGDGENCSLDLWTETAWVPMGIMWQYVIKTLGLNTVGFTFEAEEPGCELYWIYDPNDYGDFLNEEVYIDSFGDNEVDKLSGYYTRDIAIRILNDFFHTTLEKLEDFYPLCNQYNDNWDDIYDDWYINIHEFEIIKTLRD